MNAYLESLKSLIETLKANETIAEELLYSGYIKVFGAQVPSAVPMPYIVVTYYSGGLDNDAQSEASDMLFKVTVFTRDDNEKALLIQNAIHEALHNKVPASPSPTVGAYTAVYEMMPFEDNYVRQNINFVERGGIYRIRLATITQE